MPEQPASSVPQGAPPPLQRLGPWRLLLLFSKVSIIGFGGVMPFAYNALVEKRRVLSNEDFAQMFAFGQIAPGPAVANFVLTVGYRDSGAAGAAAAVTGLTALPFLLIVLLAGVYSRFADVALLRDALMGMGAVTSGLIVAMAFKMSRGMHKRPRSLLLLAAAFLSFGVMRWPFLLVIGVLAPLAVWLAWREAK